MDGANGNIIGTNGTKAVGDRNVIAYNGANGVNIVHQGNAIEGNVLSCNSARKIALPGRDVVKRNLPGHGRCSP